MNRKLIIVSVIGALGGLLFGFDTAVINGAMPFFKAHFELNDLMLGWAVSSALVGCILVALLIGKPCDKLHCRVSCSLKNSCSRQKVRVLSK